MANTLLIVFGIGASFLFGLHTIEGSLLKDESGEAPRITEQPSDTIVAKHLPATLNCRASGVPKPVIRWFKDGVPIRLGGPHRVQLPSGELFFLRVSHGRQNSDAGAYTCEATNSHGTIVSRVATLQVAENFKSFNHIPAKPETNSTISTKQNALLLREEFRLEPVSTRAAQGDTILLECAPPRGTPEPKVTWKKNSESLEIDGSSRLRLVDGGNLIIQNVKQNDEGRYQCVASNTAGTRESVTAQLNVHIKPYIIVGPQDTVAITGSSVKFQCQVGGDPLPDVLWRRSAGGGNMPLGRVHILEDRSLRLDAVTIADSGFYTCEADNAIGGVFATGYLEVYSVPNFTLQPVDARVKPGSQALFDCCAIGNPIPTLFWSIEDEKFILFPGSTYNKYSTIDNLSGKTSLVIENATLEHNEATIICSAVNHAGAAIAKAKLFVSYNEVKLPPIIELGPTNQTLPFHNAVTFKCNASGNPQPIISWYHNGTAVVSDHRVKFGLSGDLSIKDLKLNDMGMYTCVASSVNGKYIWNAILNVETQIHPKSLLEQDTDQKDEIPPQPSRPEILRLSDTHVTIIWFVNESLSVDLIGYRVEMHSKAGNDMKWHIVADRLKDSLFTYQILNKDHSYWFFVRCENSNGFSLPSEVSPEIKLQVDTKESKTSLEENTTPNNLDTILELVNVVPIDSTSAKLTWKIHQHKLMHGFYIYYGPKGSINSSEWAKMEISIITSMNINNFVIRELNKFTNYEIFLVPFFKTTVGKPSNSYYVQTVEDVPDSPPVNIEAILFNSSSVRLEWLPPPSEKRNGIIVYYELVVIVVDKVLNRTVLVANVTSKEEKSAFLLTNLTSGVSYSVTIAAATKAGVGPFSTPASLKLNSPTLETNSRYPTDKVLRPVVSDDLLSETWFLTLLLCMATILAMLFALIFAVKYRHILSKSSTVPQIYEHTSYGTSLVTHMKSAVGIPHPLDSSYSQNMVKPNTLLWNDHRSISNMPEYNYKSDDPLKYEKQNIQQIADYAEVDSSIMGFQISNKIPSPAAYASVLIVDNNLSNSRCWIQNKVDSKNTSTNAIEDEEIYPAYNGGYYNRNVYYDSYCKSNSVINRTNDFQNVVYNASIGDTKIVNQGVYSGDDDSKHDNSRHTSNDGSCLIPAFFNKSTPTCSLSMGRTHKENKLTSFGTVHQEDATNMYQEIKTPDRISSETSSINNSSSDTSEPYFHGSIQPMKLLNHPSASTKKLSYKSNVNVLGSFTMHKNPHLKTEYHSSTKSEPGH